MAIWVYFQFNYGMVIVIKGVILYQLGILNCILENYLALVNLG